jgi:hypothetical protein
VPRYLVVRKFDVDEDEIPGLSSRLAKRAMEGAEDIKWEHTHVTLDEEGLVRTYCIYTAEDEGAVTRYTGLLGEILGEHQIESVREIAADITPADFPATE